MTAPSDPFDDLVAGLGYELERPILRQGTRGIAIASTAGRRVLMTVVGPGVAPGALEARPGWDVALLDARPIETVGGERTLVVESLSAGVPSTDATVAPLPDGAPTFAVEVAERMAATHEAGLTVGYLHPDLVLVDPATGRLEGVAQRPIRADAAAEPIDGARRFFGAAFLGPSELQGRAPGPADDVFRLGALVWAWRHGADPFAGEFPDRLERTLGGTPAGGRSDELDAFLIRCFHPNPSGRPTASALADRLAHAAPPPLAPTPGPAT